MVNITWSVHQALITFYDLEEVKMQESQELVQAEHLEKWQNLQILH